MERIDQRLGSLEIDLNGVPYEFINHKDGTFTAMPKVLEVAPQKAPSYRFRATLNLELELISVNYPKTTAFDFFPFSDIDEKTIACEFGFQRVKPPFDTRKLKNTPFKVSLISREKEDIYQIDSGGLSDPVTIGTKPTANELRKLFPYFYARIGLAF